jgi:glycosyltransferase involved in cell wall biosynthesis
MSKKPAISIVIPTYNHAHFLKKCLQSVLDQTFSDWEAIIINNFSKDNTIEIVNNYQDPRIRLVNFRNNGIIAASRNEGIRLSRADVIAFLDSDDTWYPSKLSKCIEELTPERDLLCHALRFVKNGRHWKDVKCGPLRRARYYSLLYNGSCLITSAVLVRKEHLLRVGGFSENPDIVTSEDYDLWLKLAKKKTSFHFINEVLGEYEVHEANASKAALRHMNSALAVLEKHFASLKKVNIWDRLMLRRARALLFYGAARSFQKNGQRTEAMRFFGKSLLTFPFILRTYIGAILAFISKEVCKPMKLQRHA